MSELFTIARDILDAYNKNPFSGVVIFGTICTGSKILSNLDVKHMLTPEMVKRASSYSTAVYLPLSTVSSDMAVQLMEHLLQMVEESLESEFFLMRSTRDRTLIPHTYMTTVVHNGESFPVYFRVPIEGFDSPSPEMYGVMDIHPHVAHDSSVLNPSLRIRLEQAIRVVFGSKE